MSGIIEWVAGNQLTAIGTFWLASLGGSLAYQWNRNIPTNLKVIHSRLYAQALTLAALGLAGASEAYTSNAKNREELDGYKQRLAALEKKFGHDSPQYANEANALKQKMGEQ